MLKRNQRDLTQSNAHFKKAVKRLPLGVASTFRDAHVRDFDAILIEDGYARINLDTCTRCGACVKVCPCNCIVDYSVQSPKAE